MLLILPLSVPIHDEEKKLSSMFIFTLLCGASKGFMKVLKAFIKPFDAPERVRNENSSFQCRFFAEFFIGTFPCNKIFPQVYQKKKKRIISEISGKSLRLSSALVNKYRLVCIFIKKRLHCGHASQNCLNFQQNSQFYKRFTF